MKHLFGPNPKGILMIDDSGHFCFLSTSDSLPKFAVKNRAAGTAEENKAVMQGSIGVFGTYSVDQAKKAFTSHFESSTFPNENGADQERSYTLIGDEFCTAWLPAHHRHGPLMAFLQPLCLFYKMILTMIPVLKPKAQTSRTGSPFNAAIAQPSESRMRISVDRAPSLRFRRNTQECGKLFKERYSDLEMNDDGLILAPWK